MSSEAKEPREKLSPIVVAALIALVGTIIAALLGSPLLTRDRSDNPGSNPAVSLPTITIEGPISAPLGQRTYFTLMGQNVTRSEWSISGFTDEPIAVDPFQPGHRIYVEPTNASDVGSSFTIAVTVYGAHGQTAQATRQFLVVAE